MSFARAHRLATVLTAAFAFAALALGGNLPWAFVALLYLGAVYAFRSADGQHQGPYVLATALLALPILGALYFRGLELIIAAAYFGAALLLARVVARDGPEDHAQAHVLSVLVFVGGAVLNPDLSYFFAFVAFLFAVTWALLLNHLRRELGDEQLSLPLSEVVGSGLSRGVVGLTVVALFATLVTFVIFPRASFGLAFQRPFASGQSGLSDEVRLAGFGQLKLDERVMLRVSSPLAQGERLPLYWRAHVLERYDGLRWQANRRPMEEAPRRYVELRAHAKDQPLYQLGVEVVSDLGGAALPVPERAVAVLLGGRDAGGGRIEARRAGPQEVRAAGIPAAPFRYRVYLGPADLPVDRRPPSLSTLELPPQDPRIEALAQELHAQAGTGAEGASPRALASAVEAWLSSSLRYSLELPGADPSLEGFLFVRQEGHCEYFATAMAVLLRQLGVHARVVTGYYGGQWNELGGYHVVRQSAAHAWVEAWDPQSRRWLRYDPTPPEGRGGPEGARAGLLERLVDLWDALQAQWSSAVLDYNLREQVRLFQRLAEGLSGLGGGPKARARLRLPWKPLLAALALLAAVLLWRRRRGAGRARVGRAEARALALYRSLQRLGRQVGVRRRPSETAEAWSLRVAAHPALVEAERALLRQSVERYNQSRFGARAFSGAELRHLRRRLRQIGRRVGRGGLGGPSPEA